jgi:hypothetical protein
VTKRTVLSLWVAVAFCACSRPVALGSRSKTLEVSPRGDYVTAGGKWVAKGPLPGPLMPQSNVVRIECNKTEMKCREEVAMIFTSADAARFGRGVLASDITTYDVETWSGTTVRAGRRAPAADFSIVISLPAGPVTRDYQESRARGNQTADPRNRASWELQ